jgi:DNA-binding NtrC family response regulator
VTYDLAGSITPGPRHRGTDHWAENMAPLARKFLAEFAGGGNRPDVLGLSPQALGALEGYDWPGNVRELRNVVERAVTLCAGPMVGPADLPPAVRAAGAGLPPGAAPGADEAPAVPPPLHASREEAEVRRIEEALDKHHNNRLRAAQELGISRVGLYKKLHKYGLMAPGGPGGDAPGRCTR